MLNYVETPDEFSSMCSKLNSGNAFFHYIHDESVHPIVSHIIALFVYHDESDSTYVMSFSHPDVVHINTLCLKHLANCKCKKYIMNKKNVAHITDVSDCVDIAFDVYAKTLVEITTKYPPHKDIRSVPIVLLGKSFDDTLKLFKDYIGNDDPHNTNLSNDLCDVFMAIEKNALYVDMATFNLSSRDLIHENKYVYSQYNYFTPTTRPSNRFGKINFAALNKKKNERDSFISRFDTGGLVMVDYESYHLRLFADHIKFELPPNSLHEYLGRFYYDKEELSEDEYDMSKKITFNLIFGGISEDVKEHIPFMKSVSDYVELLWERFNKDGYVETWSYRRKISKEYYTQMNAYKLFNYILQSAETERNCLMGKKLNEFLMNHQSKVIMYHYDAFLIDMPKHEFGLTKEITNILTNNLQFPLRVYAGRSYGNMVEIGV